MLFPVSSAFDALPARLLDIVYAKLWTILNDAPAFDGYVRLSLCTRQAIKEILLATKDGLPDYWRWGRAPNRAAGDVGRCPERQAG